MVISMEKGMGRKFAREWYNTNRALMIAEHQRKTDAKRTKVDRYMEQMFHMADPALEDDQTGRQMQKALTELFMVKAGCLADNNDEDYAVEQEATTTTTERRDAAPTTTTTTVFTAPLLAAPSTVDDESQESELDMALDFFHDMGGCMYMTTYKAATTLSSSVVVATTTTRVS